MKALSMTQPWAWLVVHGGKLVENRTWNTSYRGEFLIHAAKGMKQSDYDNAIAFVREHVAWSGFPPIVPPMNELQRAGIIGKAFLVDVISPCATKDQIVVNSGPCFRCGRSWHMPKQYGYLLRDPEPLPFRPLRALQRFFDPENPKRQVTA